MSNRLKYTGRTKNRQPGETYTAKIEVLKEYSGVPTSIKINGFVYALVHGDFINGRKGQKRKGKS